MSNALRTVSVVCILLVAGLLVGCSDDNPASVNKPPVDNNLGGTIGIYADPEGTVPSLIDNGGVVTLYVVHKVTAGATASAFRVEAPAGWTRVGAESPFSVTIGDVEEGISVGYGTCVSGTIHVMTLTYTAPGNSEEGAMFRVLPHAQWPAHIQVVDCSDRLLEDGRGVDSPVVLPAQNQAQDKRDTRAGQD